MKHMMNTEENKIKKKLFHDGILAFEKHEFYDAHEYWEELWSDYQLSDAKFIQGLIQLAVGYFHISNLNINGARGLFTKCLPKLQEYSPKYRDIDIKNIITYVEKTLDYLTVNQDLSKFDWSLVPNLKQ